MPAKARSGGAARRACAPIFAALGDPTRLALVSRLSGVTRCSITQLTEGTQLTRQAVTKHLRVLTNARIVRSVRSGRETLFELDARPLREVRSYADAVSARWHAAAARRKASVAKR
jgi:DNA-binding transcriptional ArsR family regulator